MAPFRTGTCQIQRPAAHSVTVYSFFLLREREPEPDFEARSFEADERALAYGRALLRENVRAKSVEVWEDSLRLAHYDRSDLARHDAASANR